MTLNQVEDHQYNPKPIPRWSKIIGWIVGGFFTLTGILALFSEGGLISGIATTTLGLGLIPPVRMKLAEATGIELPIWLRTAVGILLFFIAVSATPTPEDANSNGRNSPKQKENVTPFEINNRVLKEDDVFGTNQDAKIATTPQTEAPSFARTVIPQSEPTDTALSDTCVPQPLSVISNEVVDLYDELQTFTNETKFLDVGFSRTGPYYPWLEKTQALAKSISRSDELKVMAEVGLTPIELSMLGLSYVADSQQDIRLYETMIIEGLSHSRCADSSTTVDDIIESTKATRDEYVEPLKRAPDDADEFDERVINPCLQATIDANVELRSEITPWELRKLYPETYDPIVSMMREGWQQEAIPVWIQAGRTDTAKNILMNHMRDSCIAGVRGEISRELSDTEVLQLLPIE